MKISCRHFYLSKRAKDHNYVEKKEEESGNITYIYDEKHVAQRNKKKAKKISQLAKSLKKLRIQIKKDMGTDRTGLAALAVALMDKTSERVGNRYSASDMKHYGVTTWLVKHIKISGASVSISYVGKSGVKQKKKFSDSKIANILKSLIKGKKSSDNVLEYEGYTLNDNDVNKYLRPFNITAKDIRGLHANKEVRDSLTKIKKTPPKDQKEKEKQRKEEFKKAVEEAAKAVGHEPSTLKNQYLVPGFEEKYISKGEIIGPKVAQLSVRYNPDMIKLSGIIEPPPKMFNEMWQWIEPLVSHEAFRRYMPQSKYFDLDFSGWKYKDLVPKDITLDKMRLALSIPTFGTKFVGMFLPDTFTIIIYWWPENTAPPGYKMKDIIKDTLSHELIHFTQFLIKKFGVSKKTALTPVTLDLEISPENALAQYEATDIEFYPSVLIYAERANRILSEVNPEDRLSVFKTLLGGEPIVVKLNSESHLIKPFIFFSKLKSNNPMWRKAAKLLTQYLKNKNLI
jgi:hypothetical protein